MEQHFFSINMKSKISLKIKKSEVARMFPIKSWLFGPINIFKRLCSLGAPGILVFCYKLLNLTWLPLFIEFKAFTAESLLNSIPTPRATSSLNKGSKFFLDQSQMAVVWSAFQWRQPLQQIRCACRLVIIAIKIAHLSDLLNKLYFYSRAQCSPVLLLLYK